MGIYRGPGGVGDAVADSSSEVLLALQAKNDAVAAKVAAEAAQAAAELAETHAETAEANAETAETNAATSATNAASSASSASSSASSASTSASTATTKASEASTSATNAASSASSASSSASTATTQATNASNSASAASTSATNAASSASAASTSATNAASSATSASGSATSASNSASSASTSASNAATSETNAASSASTATTQAGIATTKASDAATSATNAASSASAASTSATSASGAASAASTSATNAATSASNAAASYDSFDDRYLGPKSVAPTLDNDGNTLLIGALYFNTVDNAMKVWSGSAWLDAYASLSGALLASNNLSDLANTATARTNLGVAIGTNVQAWDADLDTWATKTAPSGAVVGTSDAQTLTNKTLTTPTIDKINTSVANTSLGAGNSSIMKNRIINGACAIAQRTTSSVTPTTTITGYPVDRFGGDCSVNSKYTLQQSSTAPTGFNNSIVATSSSAYSVGSGDYFYLSQVIEGFNTADLAFGTANAKTVTLSFWVQSSLTGTFGGTLRNGAGNRSYPFSYTISSANTWTQISVTIAGDTTGTWVGATNGAGLRVEFSLGVGSTYAGTANAWAAGTYLGVSGQTNLVATNGATWYVTGVQLEVGSSATGYEYRQYGTELALCQRYYEMIGDVVGGSTNQSLFADSYAAGGSTCQINWTYRQQKRAAPTVATYGTFTFTNGTAIQFAGNNSVLGVCVFMQPTSSTAQRSFFYNNAASGVYASAEL